MGIGIAMIDSGLTETGPLRSRVAVHVDFVDGARGAGRDFYGHGTHIAGIMAGNSGPKGDFRGMAPGAHIINLRVLAADGSGQSSNVIEAIDWTIENKARYGIRVLNVSLGHPAIEAAADDPLVLAVERAVQSGLVVVCSAGNLGKHPVTGQRIIGAISSPGNSPSVITVGALNTKGTPQRSDDEVASYSSRGPTYGDGFVKPDLVAPGNRIVSLAAPASKLWLGHPEQRRGPGYIELSGTSQAAAVVAGAAALVLEANPNLNPRQVKLALQGTASFCPGWRRRRGGRQPERRRRGADGQARTCGADFDAAHRRGERHERKYRFPGREAYWSRSRHSRVGRHAGLGRHPRVGRHAGLGRHPRVGRHAGLGRHPRVGRHAGLGRHPRVGRHAGLGRHPRVGRHAGLGRHPGLG